MSGTKDTKPGAPTTLQRTPTAEIPSPLETSSNSFTPDSSVKKAQVFSGTPPAIASDLYVINTILHLPENIPGTTKNTTDLDHDAFKSDFYTALATRLNNKFTRIQTDFEVYAHPVNPLTPWEHFLNSSTAQNFTNMTEGALQRFLDVDKDPGVLNIQATDLSRDTLLRSAIQLLQRLHTVLGKEKTSRTLHESQLLERFEKFKLPNHKKPFITLIKQEIKQIAVELKNEAEKTKQSEKKIPEKFTSLLKDIDKTTPSKTLFSGTTKEAAEIKDTDYSYELRKIKDLDCVEYLYPLYLEQNIIDALFDITQHERFQKEHRTKNIHGALTPLKDTLEAIAPEYRRIYNTCMEHAKQNPQPPMMLLTTILNMHHLTYMNTAIKKILDKPMTHLDGQTKVLFKGILTNIFELNEKLLKNQVARLHAIYAEKYTTLDAQNFFNNDFNRAKKEIYDHSQAPFHGMPLLHDYLEKNRLATRVQARSQISQENPGIGTAVYEINFSQFPKKSPGFCQ